MQHRKSKLTTPNWAVEMRSMLVAKTREPIGKGWMTTDKFCASLNVSQGTGLRYLRKGIALGKIERFTGTMLFGNLIRTQTWYRPLKGKGK
jgi:hypothetical protein